MELPDSMRHEGEVYVEYLEDEAYLTFFDRQSQAGEYVSTLFWVTGISLVISWFAAVYFTPWLGYWLLKVRHKADAHGRDAYQSRPYRAIRAVVAWCVRRPTSSNWPVTTRR